MVLNLMAWIGGGTAKARFLRFLLKGGLRMRTLVDGDDLVAQRVRRRHCGGCEGVGDEVIAEGNAGWREHAGRDVSVWGPSPSELYCEEETALDPRSFRLHVRAELCSCGAAKQQLSSSGLPTNHSPPPAHRGKPSQHVSAHLIGPRLADAPCIARLSHDA